MKSFLPHVGAAAINNFVGNTPVSVIDWDAAEHQMKIINSEVNELNLAVANRNYNEFRDGINDGRFTVDGMASRMNVDVQSDFDELMRSMLSKFDICMEDAVRSQVAYAEKGVITEIRPGTFDGTQYYIQISADDQVDSKGKRIPRGKYLKSFRFEEPVYLLPDNAVCFTLEFDATEDKVLTHNQDLLGLFMVLNNRDIPDLNLTFVQLRMIHEGKSTTYPGWEMNVDRDRYARLTHTESGIELLSVNLDSVISGKDNGISYTQTSGVDKLFLDIVITGVDLDDYPQDLLGKLLFRVMPKADMIEIATEANPT